MIRPAPICDWLSFRHDYPINDPAPALWGGRILKINASGEIDYEVGTWDAIKCPSSDTSVRIRCDGSHLHFSGNAGRFGFRDNVTGVGLLSAFERAVEVIAGTFPRLRMSDVGSVYNEGRPNEWGTRLTRIDLAANFETDNYPALMQVCANRRIGQRMPQMGKFGPTWGYDTKRGQYHKEKLYDKTAESEGRRSVSHGATLARFEVQLGSEYLRQNNLSRLKHWTEDMGKIVYGKFADQVLRESVSVENWKDLPVRLRHHAIMWRDGIAIESYCNWRTAYRIKSKLREFGIDISVPCNVLALSRQVRVVEVRPVENMRVAA